MATATRKTAARKAPARMARASGAPVVHEATAPLRAGHKRVNALFEQYEKSRSTAKKKRIVTDICRELSVHAKAEREIFYPAVKAALKDKEMVPEATVEHATLKELMAQVEGKDPDGEMFDAKIKVLCEYVRHHVKEEETEMFPKARKTKLDMQALGAQIAARKEEPRAAWVPDTQRPSMLAKLTEGVAG